MEEGTTSRRDSSSRVDSSLPPPLNRTRFKSLCLTRSQENNFKLQRAFLSSSRVELPPQLPEITKDWRIQNSGEYPWALNSTRDRPSTSQSSKSKRRWSAFIINSDREASTNGLSRVETMEFGSTNHTSEEVPSPPYFQNETHPQTATNFYPFPADRSDRGQNLRQGSGRNNQTGLNKVRRLSWVHFSSPHNSVRNPPRLESKKKRKKRKSISGTLISMIFNVFKHRSQSNQVKKPGKHPVLTSVSSDRDSLNRIGQESNRIHIHENRNLSMAYNRIEHEHRTTQMSNHEMLNPVSLQSMELTTSVAWQNNVTAIQSRALKESMTQGFPVTISNKEDQFFIQNQFGSYVRQKQIRNSLSFTRESRSHLSPKPIRTTVESRIKLTEQSPQHYARKCTLNVRNASGQINQAIRNKRVGKLEGEFENSELIRAEPQPAIISTISLPRAKVEISNLDNIGSYIQSEECKLSPMKREWVQHQPTQPTHRTTHRFQSSHSLSGPFPGSVRLSLRHQHRSSLPTYYPPYLKVCRSQETLFFPCSSSASHRMPAAAHHRMPSFPFRKRRASSASSARSSACLNNQQVANVIPPIPPIPGPFTAISLSKDTSPCNQAAMTTPDQMNHSNCSSDTLPPFLKSRQRSFDFGRIQAKVSSVRLRGKSEDPNSRSSGNSLNNPEYLERKYQSGSEQKSLSNRQIIRRSILPSRLTADLNLSIRNSLNSNLNKASGIIRSDQLGIQLHCSNSAESCDQTSDSSLIKPSQHSNSSASLNQKSSKSNLHQSFSLVSPDAVNLWPTKSSTNLSPASLPVTSGKDSVFLLRPNSIEIKTEDQDALKIASEPHSDILNNIAECSLSASTSNFSARVRPTPSPRCPQSLDGEYGPDPKPPFPDHHRPSPRRPILPSKLRALPRLDSYSLQVPKQPSATQSQSSLDSSDHHGPAQEDYDIAGEINSETDGVSSEESSPARGTEELANVCRPGVSHLIGEISLALTTSATSLSLALPNSSISAHFESQPIVSVTPAPEAPVDRARALRSAPPPSVKVSSTCLFPRRPSIGSRRSLSVADFGRLGTGGPSSMCASSPHEDFASASQKSLFNIGVESSLGSSAMPKEGLLKTISISESSPSANPEATSLLIASPSQSSVPFTHRRQSMYEMRLANDPPPYQDTLQGLNNAKHKILPREEEGREGLPKYSCSIHLEGWMPRKMEFRSPGVQAKDRAWKRQYIVLHGTMMRIYRSDPHAHPVPGNDDTYSYHHIQCPSSSPFLGSSSPNSKSAVAVAPPLHFHQGRYDSAPSTSLKEVAFAKASQLPTQHNSLQRVYTLQNAESGLAADYLKRKYTVRVRAEGEQFLLQAKDDRGVIDLIEALQAATNVSLDLDVRPLPKFITLPRRRRRRRAGAATTATSGPQSGREIGAAVIAGMIAEVEASHRQSRRARFDHGRRQTYHENNHAGEVVGDRMAEMLAEEQEAYLTSRN